MKGLIFASLVACALAVPAPQKLGNPDEWGPYFQGDIKFAPGRSPKNGLIDESYRWPNGTVSYRFDDEFPLENIATVLSVMNDYENSTDGCITFIETDIVLSSHIHITGVEEDGCFSYVGMIGRQQRLNYPQWCIDQYGSVQHELYHALGFYHEQSRTDRDDYVTINYDNIQDGTESNFDKYDEDLITDFGYSYDYLSVMHYSGRAFSKNGQITIKTTDPEYQTRIGQRDFFTDTDLGKLMAMYKCDEK